jgi:hypothetical protein
LFKDVVVGRSWFRTGSSYPSLLLLERVHVTY